MKKQSEAEKEELKQKFRRENLIPEDELKPPGIFLKSSYTDAIKSLTILVVKHYNDLLDT